MQSKPNLSALVWFIPALVVLGNLGYLMWLNQSRRGLSGLGPLLLFMFLVVPESVLFLVAYAATIRWLRGPPRPWGTLQAVGLASLAGLAACALSIGLLFGAWWLEMKLG
jgi:hypothetical protein